MAEDYREVYARAVNMLADARHCFAPVFRVLVANIEDDGLYSRSSLATLAKEQGIISADLSRLFFVFLPHVILRAGFPDDGDGTLNPIGVPIPAWYGIRWKAAFWKIVVEEKPPPSVGRMLLQLSWIENE